MSDACYRIVKPWHIVNEFPHQALLSNGANWMCPKCGGYGFVTAPADADCDFCGGTGRLSQDDPRVIPSPHPPFDTTKWISNPLAFGVIGYYPEAGKPAVGTITDRDGRATGSFGPKAVYTGHDAIEAMQAVERAYEDSQLRAREERPGGAAVERLFVAALANKVDPRTLEAVMEEYRRLKGTNPIVPKLSDEEIRAWSDRHCIYGSTTDLRCAFEDAQTFIKELPRG